MPAKRNENNMPGPAYFEIIFPIKIYTPDPRVQLTPSAVKSNKLRTRDKLVHSKLEVLYFFFRNRKLKFILIPLFHFFYSRKTTKTKKHSQI